MYSKNVNNNKLEQCFDLLLEQEMCVQMPSRHKRLGVFILVSPF